LLVHSGNPAFRNRNASEVGKIAISIYCALVASDFRQGVILAVNHDGDSDSTGSITGNLLGTMNGLKAIPGEWLQMEAQRARCSIKYAQGTLQ